MAFDVSKLHINRRAADLAERLKDGAADLLLDTYQQAELLQCAKQTLEIWRTKGLGPPYIKTEGGRVRYRLGDTRAWLRERERRWTGEYRDPAKRQGRPHGSKVIDGRVVPPAERNADSAPRKPLQRRGASAD